MSDFRIWGTITQTEPSHFFVIATAISDPPLAFEWTAIRTGDASSLAAAQADVVARGDRVVDVEEVEEVLETRPNWQMCASFPIQTSPAT